MPRKLLEGDTDEATVTFPTCPNTQLFEDFNTITK